MDFFVSLAHYFYPRYSNNHRARLIHSSSILLFTLALVTYQFVLSAIQMTGTKVLGYAANISTDEVIRLTNEKRAQAGAPALRYNPQLAQAALAKGNHMLQYDYWAHVAPDGTEPWKFFTDAGYKYRYAGENLARDFTNPTSTVEAWMASPSHKENLLSTKYVEIGIAVVEGDLAGSDTTLIIQLFGTPLLDTATQQVPAAAAAQPVATATPIPTAIPTVILTTTPTPSETPKISPTIALITGGGNDGGSLTSLPPASQDASTLDILISPFSTTKGISIAITSILLIVLVIDGIVVARKRISRIGGRNFAHFAFLGMILVILLIAKAGEIL